ncbi:zinc finger protein VAR3, chloroplastic [Phalaenopsis equestris]|uniref:zinc finger protein VAR3, chloroplastic n=1 Tax=Phalaenopsis equestris TaxID=78828 RepID=UPI0009E3F459|nr:zinc finger protein VAR3, chloroplastic [Phalaenopsis equestris]
MPSSFKLLMILSTPFSLRPSAAIHFARHSRLPLEALSFTAASRGRLLCAVPSSKFGFSIRAAGQVHTQSVAKEGCSEAVSSYAGFKDSYSWPEWSKLADHLLAKGYSQREVTPGDQDDFALTGNDLPEEFLRPAEACLDFARERPDILRLLTKNHIKEVIENGSPFLFKNGDKSVNRMRLFLSGDASTELEQEKAQTIDIMRYLLSYMYKLYSPSNGNNQFKDYEVVETSVRKLLLELFNFSGTLWKSKLAEPTETVLPLGNEQLSRPPGQSFEMKRGDWICQKCTFMNFARNMSCLECGEARPKRQLAGAEWECPQCDFFNYGRNKSCLRCDHRRPGDGPLSSTPAAGLEHAKGSNIEQNISVSKQGFQVGSSIRSESDDNSDSISRRLDRILSRSSNPSGSMSNNTSANQRRNPESIPFVPLPPNMFRKAQESNNGVQQSSDKGVASSPNPSELIDSLVKASENTLKSGISNESSDASLRWSNTATGLENAKDPTNAVSGDDFPDIMPVRKGENRFVVSKKKDRSLTSPTYKRRLAMEQSNNYNSVPFVPFPPGYFAKKDNQLVTDSSGTSAILDEVETLNRKEQEQNLGSSDQGFEGASPQSGGKSYGYSSKSEYSGIPTGSSSQPTDMSLFSNRETMIRKNAPYGSPYYTTQPDANLGKYSGYSANLTQKSTNSWNNNPNSSQTPNSSAKDDFFSSENTENSTKPSDNSWNNKNASYGGSSADSPHNHQTSGNIQSGVYSGKSLEGSCVKELDPLDMSEEAKAERWFRRAAQIKDISELAQIPDEDFPEIMPMRKGVNRFVVSKRKTPLERRLTSPQYRRNLPIVSSEVEVDDDD